MKQLETSNQANASNFARAYPENLERPKSVTGLTPAEEQMGDCALALMHGGKHLLLQHHVQHKSLAEIGDGWGKPEDRIRSQYEAAVRRFASCLVPLLPRSCATCLLQMPEIVSNLCLRCPECRPVIDDLWRRTGVTRIPVQRDAQLLASYLMLGLQPTAPIRTVRQAVDKQLDHIRWALSDSAPGHLKPVAVTALTTLNTAWDRIRKHHPTYEH